MAARSAALVRRVTHDDNDELVRSVIVTTSYPAWPGDPSGHFVQAEARAMAREGGEVIVVAPRASDDPDLDLDLRPRPLHVDVADPGVRVVRIDGGTAFGWPGVHARLRERPTRAVSFARWVVHARRALAGLAPTDCFVAHWCVPSAWPVVIGVPGELHVVSHGADVRALLLLPRFARDALVLRIARRAARWRFVSHALFADLAGALGGRALSRLGSVAAIEPCALDMPDVASDILRLRREHADAPLYVSAGRLVASKRVDRAIEHIASLGSPARFVVVGDGPERASLERLARAKGLDARFVGMRSRTETLAWIGAANALVHASRLEGLSTVVREARALGVAVWSIA